MLKIIKKNRSFLLFVVCLFSARWSIADHYRVPTGSMIPTIHVGDHVFVNKMAYDLKLPFTNISLKEMNEPKRGDIVIFEYPHDRSINYVKRLIALPGDKVQIKDGFVVINGKISLKNPEELKERQNDLLFSDFPFTYQEAPFYIVQRIPRAFRPHELSFTVPPGQYFMMGDNRDISGDSRSWGFVPRNHFMGKIQGVTISAKLDDGIPQIKFSRFGKKLL